MQLICRWCFAIVTLSMVSCAPVEKGTWKSDQWQSANPIPVDKSFYKLPANRLGPGSIVMEIAVGQLDEVQRDEIDALWRQIDRQSIPLATRKIFDQNGMRLGIVGSQIPGVLDRLLADKEIDTDGMQQWQKEYIAQSGNNTVPRLILHQQIQNNEGETHATPLSDTVLQTSWVVRSGDKNSPGQGDNVRGYLCFRTYPKGDGGVRLIVYPEIRMGQMRSTIGVEDDTFLFQSEQTARSIEELRFEVNLRPGETLLVGPSQSMSGLGQLFFGPTETVNFHQRMIMVRLVQSQRNDLFETDSSF